MQLQLPQEPPPMEFPISIGRNSPQLREPLEDRVQTRLMTLR